VSILDILKRRKTAASVTVLAVLAAGTLTAAVAYRGFPVDDVDLDALDVWVTNQARALTGRLNTQIGELNGGVVAPGDIDVMQHGDDVFVFDADQSAVQRIHPSFSTLGQRIDLPPGAGVGYGGDRLAIVDPRAGGLWIVDAATELLFDRASTPVIELGENAAVAVSLDGTVYGVAPEDGVLYRVPSQGGAPQKAADVSVEDYAITTVGTRAVILDLDTNEIVFDDGSRVELPSPALRLQQPGPERADVVVATGDGLLRVGFDKSVTAVSAEAEPTATDLTQVAAPVVVDGCIHAAWATSARYLALCDGAAPLAIDIPNLLGDAELEFRVNKSVVALNNLVNGDIWLVQDDLIDVVENWAEVTPPEQEENDEVGDEVAQQTFEETLAERTEQNRPPTVHPDSLGARPGRTTILAVLDNDSDPDGDVLTVTGVSDVPEAAGTVTLIDSGRALQFEPASGASGTVSFRYSVSDGRPGGTGETQVDVAVRASTENAPPIQTRTVNVALEAGQTMTSNVLRDWLDPDGDDLLVTGAASDTGDVVRFRPDGDITFTHVSAELGQKTVSFTVSDGIAEPVLGQIVFDVKAIGSLNPVGTPDFVSTFIGKTVEIEPLDNDLSPSGAPLGLAQVEALTDGITPAIDLDAGVVSVAVGAVGVYYLQYTLTAGAKQSIGLIRVDVQEDPENPLPPVAVKDTAYLRPNEPTSLRALVNDVSPSGRVLGIQGYDLPIDSQLSVEILGGGELRITAPSGMTEQAQFEYTISDGFSTSTAGVTVVPVPELSKHQAPIAADDTVKVRAGDIAAVAVLANDYHPDGARMSLDPELVEEDLAGGLAFVSGEELRIQAPSEPGQYVVTYRITDEFSESATARVVVTVIEPELENNKAPLAKPLETRVFQGAAVTVDIPVDGIDPDGDSVVFVSAAGATQGAIVGQSSTSFVYQAAADGQGTDVFSYQLRDALGATATGEVRIGVIPRGATDYPPSAVDDQVAIRPERIATVDVLANDSDPNGYEIRLETELLEVQEGITAEVRDGAIVVTAGEEPGTYSLQYSVDNGHSIPDRAFAIVTVDPEAPILPPTAIDHVIEPADVVAARTVDVDVLEGASNPGGLTGDLVVSLDGPNAGIAEVGNGGLVTVTLGDTRQAVAYRLTNEIDELSTWAFIIVPRYSDGEPPYLKQQYLDDPPVISMNGSATWSLADLLEVPSGRRAIIADETTVTALRSNGDPLVVDASTIRYTPETDYRGESTLTFTVTDGNTPEDPSGNVATITLPVIVGDPEFRDVAPTFADATIEIEPGEAATTFDLRNASSHPNPAVVRELSYTGLANSNGVINAGIAGSTLEVAAPRTATGETSLLTFDVSYGDFTIEGHVTVVVVPSTRPLPQAVDDSEPEGRSNSTYTVDVLANDYNPFATEGEPLVVVDAFFEGANLGATVSNTASTVRVTTGSAKSGTISVIYVVRDATDTEEREVQGRLTVVVASAPEPVTSITVTNPSSQTVTVVFQAPSSSNGAPITGYTVRIAGSPSTATRTDCVPGASCTFSGRTNGAVQTVDVAATNKVGTTWSTTRTITPYGTPSAPSGPNLSTNSSTATATITPTWSAPSNTGGGSITYEWSYTAGVSGSGSTTGTSGSARSVGEGDYTFQVRACNPGGCSGYVSDSVHINAPPPTIALSKGAQTGVFSGCSSGNCYYFRVNAQNFTPNANFTVNCFSNDGSGEVSIGSTPYRAGSSTQLQFNGSGDFSGDVYCWDGYGNVNRVTISGVSSNLSDF
jgi:hypothetical protein